MLYKAGSRCLCLYVCVFECFGKRRVIEIILVCPYLLFHQKAKERLGQYMFMYIIQLIQLDYTNWR